MVSDPTKKDSDGDSWDDNFEKTQGTSPFSKDSDYDGLIDSEDPEPLVLNGGFNFDMSLASDEYYSYVAERTLDISKDIDYILIRRIEIMMNDINSADDKFLQSISYSEWSKFCDNFNENVRFVYGGLLSRSLPKKVHYFRNKLNRAPATLDSLLANSSGWAFYDVDKTRYHMSGDTGGYNVKFSSLPDGKYEAVYDKNGVLLTQYNDGDNMGTYNYCSELEGGGVFSHGKLDVDPFKDWGNTPNNPPKSDDEYNDFSDKYESDQTVIEYRNGIKSVYEINGGNRFLAEKPWE
jgi:hypothetical protein